MKDMNMFEKIYEGLIKDIEKFCLKNESFNTENFINNIKKCIIHLKEMSDDELSEISYICLSDLKSIRDIHNESDDELETREFTHLLLYYYSLYNKIEIESNEWEEKVKDIDKCIEDYFFEQKKLSTVTYYKNLMPEAEQHNFEKILELLSGQLKKYDINLYYCKKILDFFDKYYPNEIFPQDIFFLNNYLGNTAEIMILTISKLYLDKCDIEKKKNCGIKYLKYFIEKKVNDKSSIEDILEEINKKIGKVVPIIKELKLVRNKLIAHWDIKDIGRVQDIKIHIKELFKVYDLSCEILELLSLGYFEYKDIFSQKMIQKNSFKFFVCQNALIHNSNPYYESDIDSYLKTIKMKFDVCKQNKNS